MMTPPSTPRKKVEQHWLNQQFNENSWESRLASYTEVPIHDSLTPPERGQAKGTVTVGYDYYDAENRLVATVFHYRKPDGKLGASGRLTPKGLLIDGVWCHT
jgi:hypothetical protein